MTQATITSTERRLMKEGKALLPTPSLQKAEGTIECFKGKNCILSNFYPCTFKHFGKTFCCVEQAYQYEKAVMYGRQDVAAEIMSLNSGYQIWLAAKKIKVDGRWEKCRVNSMRSILISRMFGSMEYRRKLESVKGIIVEAVPGDTFWSAGLPADQVLSTPQENWPGENVMGRLHMEMRRGSITSRAPNPPAKRPREDDGAVPEAKQAKTDLLGKCNWCLQPKELLPGKKFCARCGENGRECAHCHRAMPEKYYTLNEKKKLCDRCHRKYYKQLERRRQQKGGGPFLLPHWAKPDCSED